MKSLQSANPMMNLLIHVVLTRFRHDQNQINRRRITPSIARFSRALEFDIVAESIEEDLQMVALCELGCLYGQSFQISWPLPCSQVLMWVYTNKRRHPLTPNALGNGVDHFAQPRKIVAAGKRWIEIPSDDDRR